MNGYCVNDTPVLIDDEICVTMIKNVTDVSQEYSYIILTDNNFATISIAVK